MHLWIQKGIYIKVLDTARSSHVPVNSGPYLTIKCGGGGGGGGGGKLHIATPKAVRRAAKRRSVRAKRVKFF